MNTPEERAAYVISQSVCALIEAMGMVAENKQREHRGESMAYDACSFPAVDRAFRRPPQCRGWVSKVR